MSKDLISTASILLSNDYKAKFVKQLPVSGPFHSPLIESCVVELKSNLLENERYINESKYIVLSNYNNKMYTKNSFVDLLVNQVIFYNIICNFS